MRIRYAPFVIAPFLLLGHSNILQNQESQRSAVVVENDLNIPDSYSEIIKIQIKTPEEKKAVDNVEGFLKTYTVNGKFNYGTITQMLEGLYVDYAGVNAEADTLEGIEKSFARSYSPKSNKFIKKLVKHGIKEKATLEMENDLLEFGVDLKTATDECVDEKLLLVTKAVLRQYRTSAQILRNMIERELLENKMSTAPDGYSVEVARFIKAGKIGLPPGIVIVDRKEVVSLQN